MDGFVRSGGNASSSHKIKNNSDISASRAKIKSTAQSVHKRAQRSQTLMRSVVRRPEQSQQAKVAAPKVHPVQTDSKRNTRAQSITKHANVRRFGHVLPKNKPSSIVSDTRLAKPSQPVTTDSRAVVQKRVPSMVTSASHAHLERLLDEALSKADAHKKAINGYLPNRNLWQKVRTAPKWASLGTAVLIVGLLSGFFAWQNLPAVSMRVAATRAHVSAQVPGYTPSGFSFAGPVNHKEGSVTIKFKANSDSSRNFSLTQANSNLSSKSLADSDVVQNNPQTFAVNGNTIYVYGPNNDATWVDHGVQYTIRDNANLTSDQLLRIANSL
jgi:hypothetical protein